MSDEVFRIIISVAVGLACISFMMQAFYMSALYRAVRKMQEKIENFAGRGEKLIDKINPVTDSLAVEMPEIRTIVKKLSAASDKVGPILVDARVAIDKTGVVIEKTGAVIERAGPAVDSVNRILATGSRILDETRPRINEVTSEVVAVTRESRQQVERLGEFLVSTADRARNRLDQIDHTLDTTIGQVEQVGESVKKAVMRPVKEVNGLAAGLSAVVSTLVKRPRRSSVDSATQDEEMFI